MNRNVWTVYMHMWSTIRICCNKKKVLNNSLRIKTISFIVSMWLAAQQTNPEAGEKKKPWFREEEKKARHLCDFDGKNWMRKSVVYKIKMPYEIINSTMNRVNCLSFYSVLTFRLFIRRCVRIKILCKYHIIHFVFHTISNINISWDFLFKFFSRWQIQIKIFGFFLAIWFNEKLHSMWERKKLTKFSHISKHFVVLTTYSHIFGWEWA